MPKYAMPQGAHLSTNDDGSNVVLIDNLSFPAEVANFNVNDLENYIYRAMTKHFSALISQPECWDLLSQELLQDRDFCDAIESEIKTSAEYVVDDMVESAVNDHRDGLAETAEEKVDEYISNNAEHMIESEVRSKVEDMWEEQNNYLAEHDALSERLACIEEMLSIEHS